MREARLDSADSGLTAGFPLESCEGNGSEAGEFGEWQHTVDGGGGPRPRGSSSRNWNSGGSGPLISEAR
jgi:hypothetical protein